MKTTDNLTAHLAAELFAKMWHPANQVDPKHVAAKALEAAEAFAAVVKTRKES